MDLAIRWLLAVLVAFTLPSAVFAKEAKKKSAAASTPAKDEADIDQIREELGVNGCTAPSIEHLLAELEARKDDEEAVAEFGVAYATLQTADLLANGAPGAHFYTLNRSPATRAIMSALKLWRPWDAERTGLGAPRQPPAAV